MTGAAWAPRGEPRRLLLGAFGDPGHAFPMLALGQRLAARGHDVTLQTWTRWRAHAEAGGMRFAPAPEYPVFPTSERALKPYQAVYRAALDTRSLVRELEPNLVVADVLTLAPALAAELEGVPVATLVPHVFPAGDGADGHPPHSFGARLPATAFGRGLWRALERPVSGGLERGRDELNETRARLGLGALTWLHGGLSRCLTLVATFPQLEFPRQWPSWARVVGPLLWEPPGGEAPSLPPGDGPVVLVAPSTSQDPEHRLLRAALEGLAECGARVLASLNGHAVGPGVAVPSNARVADWLSYAQTMPRCDLVVCHGGHGTVARALACGVPVLVCPSAGDQNENAARADWAGVGVRLPGRLCTPRCVRLAVERALGDALLSARARALGAWAAGQAEPGAAVETVEALAADVCEESRSFTRG